MGKRLFLLFNSVFLVYSVPLEHKWNNFSHTTEGDSSVEYVDTVSQHAHEIKDGDYYLLHSGHSTTETKTMKEPLSQRTQTPTVQKQTLVGGVEVIDDVSEEPVAVPADGPTGQPVVVFFLGGPKKCLDTKACRIAMEKFNMKDLLAETAETQVVKPQVVKPQVAKPQVAEPKVTEPKVTEPKVTEPKVTEPKVTKPQGTKPQGTKPQGTKPQGTKPHVHHHHGHHYHEHGQHSEEHHHHAHDGHHHEEHHYHEEHHHVNHHEEYHHHEHHHHADSHKHHQHVPAEGVPVKELSDDRRELSDDRLCGEIERRLRTSPPGSSFFVPSDGDMLQILGCFRKPGATKPHIPGVINFIQGAYISENPETGDPLEVGQYHEIEGTFSLDDPQALTEFENVVGDLLYDYP